MESVAGAPALSTPLSRSSSRHAHDEPYLSRPGSSAAGFDGSDGALYRPDTAMSQSQTLTPSRGGTLKKKNSLKRGASLKRSGSRKSLAAGSVKSLALGDKEKYSGSDVFSAFSTPVPTHGQPTEILANRFQDWRRVLKDLVAYFREVQKSHDARSKSLLSLSNLTSNILGPTSFLAEGGIGNGTKILKDYHRRALSESNKAKQIEEEVILQLSGLRSDLSTKIKEIKSLSGDFKNSVDKEMESTRKAVKGYQEALGLVETDPHATSGKGDPFIIRLGVERQIDRQVDEENYLHKAFLNLESSGRELESIVVGEIQKAYNAYAAILKRDAEAADEVAENLRAGPISMSKDHEWNSFVSKSDNFVDPALPIRRPDQIQYPGKDAPAAAEVRSGMLERKSKYLKSYTPGWYVLSTTHLHEFKSPDRITSQAPVMSLYLQEQKLGSRSNPDSSSHKFMLKGRQTGGMHRGHGWVFRAESHDTMLAWYEDIRNLTEKTGREREAFVRKHARSMSGSSSRAPSISSDGGMDEDEADHVPYAAHPAAPGVEAAGLSDSGAAGPAPLRPQPGGRFQSSNLSVDRGLHPRSPSSGASDDDRDTIAAAGALPDLNPGPVGHGSLQSSPQEYQNSTRTHAFARPADADVPVHEDGADRPLYTLDMGASPTTPGPLTASRVLPASDGSAEPSFPDQSTGLDGPERNSGNTVSHDFALINSEIVETSPTGAGQAKSEYSPVHGAAPVARHVLSGTTPTTMSIMTTSTVQTEDAPLSGPSRPPPISQNSTRTISDLHVPGEFPKPGSSAIA